MINKLKIITLFTTIFIGANGSFAQNVQNFGNADNFYPWAIRQNLNDTAIRASIVNLKIKNEETTRTNTKGKKAVSVNKYNEDGSISLYGQNRLSNKKYIYSYALNYGQNGLDTMNISNFKGLFRTKSYERDKSGNVITYISKDNSRRAFVYRVENEIINGNLQTRSIYKNGKSDSKYQSWNYTYHENGSRALTKFFKKNKLKYTWNYDCKVEGIEENTKDTSTICTWKETDAKGNPITWTKTTNEKGKVIKGKTVVEKGTEKLISYEEWDMSGRPITSNIKSFDKWTYTRYKKGKLDFQSTSNFAPKTGQISSTTRTFTKHPRWNSSTEFVYDNNGLILKEISIRNGKLHEITTTKREFYK